MNDSKSVIKFLKDRIIQIRKDAGQFYIYVVKGGVMTNSKEGVQAEGLQEALAEMWSKKEPGSFLNQFSLNE